MLFFTNLLFILCKIQVTKALLKNLKNGEALQFFYCVLTHCSTLRAPSLKKSVCSAFINDKQAFFNIYFHHISFRNKVMEKVRKITKAFQNLQKLVRAGTRNTLFFFYMALFHAQGFPLNNNCDSVDILYGMDVTWYWTPGNQYVF